MVNKIMLNINEAWESFSSFPEDKKNIVIDLISKIKESSKMKEERLEIESRRKEIKSGQFLSHEDFWTNV